LQIAELRRAHLAAGLVPERQHPRGRFGVLNLGELTSGMLVRDNAIRATPD
jgi:hypothetical protein